MAKLTEKQHRFADEYIRLGNATEAARLAGYKKPNPQGTENLAKPSIKSYINGVLEEMASKRIMQASEAMELLTTIARGEMEETMYIGTSDGVITIEDKKPDINQRTTALKEILKRYPIDREGKERLLQAQADKATAEAALAKNKADKLTQSGKVNELLQSLLDVKSGGDGSGQADV
ncbi:terminase small subunit [Enterococcus viikkiensis]|uniref:terminase small subunit n=1 Tax=Enterococcus viikkiensis TaxID=930854 RepID=UPI0010F7DFF4|nr:terminase small subunit [Enterococcus viikkiensis]